MLSVVKLFRAIYDPERNIDYSLTLINRKGNFKTTTKSYNARNCK